MTVDFKDFIAAPLVPTVEMEIAGTEAALCGRAAPDDGSYVRAIYQAMLRELVGMPQ